MRNRKRGRVSERDLQGYGAAARKLALSPRNQGELRYPDAVGSATTYHCNGRIEVQLKVDRETQQILDARFVSTGCPAAVAALSVATELLRGKRVEDAGSLDWCVILSVVGSVPPSAEGCVHTAVIAVREAAYDYREWVSSHITMPGIPDAMVGAARSS